MAVDDDILRTLNKIEKLLQSNLTEAKQTKPNPTNGNTNQNQNQQSPGKTTKVTVASIKALGDSTDNLNNAFTKLNRTVLNTRTNLIQMNTKIRNLQTPSPGSPPGPIPIVLPPGSPPSPVPVPNPAPTPIPPVIPPGSPPSPGPTPVPPGGPRLPILNNKLIYAATALTSIFVSLKGAIVPLVNDYLLLHSTGIQASSALKGMYIDAARAGMSLAEYNSLLVESSVLVSRSASMEDFNKTISVTTGRLENLGIFGAEATKLAAELNNSTALLGIPQKQMLNATNAQVDVFEQLRKSSLLTADSFQQLTAQLAQQQEVQSNLLGLAPEERAARLVDITGMKTFGLSLGGSKAASDAFGEALIRQRNQTVGQRFESAGRIRQSGAVLGMDVNSVEQLAQLSRKKNLSGDDKAVALRLGSELQSRIESAMNSGDVNKENIAEQLQTALDSSGVGTLLKAAGNLKLSTDSGPARANKDFATGASDFLKATGKFSALLDGMGKNPVASALMSAIGSAMFTLGLGKIIGAAISGFSAGGIGGAMSSVINVFKSAGNFIIELAKKLTNIGGLFTSIRTFITTALGGLGPGLLGGLKAVLGGAFKFLGGSGLIGGVFGGIMELFTGDISDALNANDDKKWFGNGISGFVDKLTGKIADVISGMVRGFFTGFTNLGDLLISGWNSTIGSIFSSLTINLGGTLTNFFDSMWTSLNIMFKESKLKVAKFFGMSDTAKDLEKDIAKAKETKDLLNRDTSLTLTTVGDAGKKLLAEQKVTADKTTQSLSNATAATKVVSNVVTSTEGLTQRLISDIPNQPQIQKPTVQPTVVTPPVTTVTPIPPVRNTVTQPVNTPPQTTANTANVVSPPPTNTQPIGNDPLLTQLIQMNATLVQMLTVEQQQQIGIDSLSRGLNRTPFTNNEANLKLLNRV